MEWKYALTDSASVPAYRYEEVWRKAGQWTCSRTLIVICCCHHYIELFHWGRLLVALLDCFSSVTGNLPRPISWVFSIVISEFHIAAVFHGYNSVLKKDVHFNYEQNYFEQSFTEFDYLLQLCRSAPCLPCASFPQLPSGRCALVLFSSAWVQLATAGNAVQYYWFSLLWTRMYIVLTVPRNLFCTY